MNRNYFCLIAFLILGSLFLTTKFVNAKKWIVEVNNYSFVPSNLTHVKAGDTIQWKWVEGVHTTTSTSVPESADTWDSPIMQDDPFFIYIPKVNGTFKYQCTPHAASMTGTFVVSGASGISSETEIPSLTIFPNPFIDHFTIQMTNTAIRMKSLDIFSLQGELIWTSKYEKGFFPGTVSIDIKNLLPGIYMIRIIDNFDRSLSRKVSRI